MRPTTTLTGGAAIAMIVLFGSSKPLSKSARSMPRSPATEFSRSRMAAKKRSKVASRTKKKDPVFVDGARPRPMFVDYKDLELLTKLTSRQGKLIGRRKSGCTAASQHAVSRAVKRARFMALLPYVAD